MADTNGSGVGAASTVKRVEAREYNLSNERVDVPKNQDTSAFQNVLNFVTGTVQDAAKAVGLAADLMHKRLGAVTNNALKSIDERIHKAFPDLGEAGWQLAKVITRGPYAQEAVASIGITAGGKIRELTANDHGLADHPALAKYMPTPSPAKVLPFRG